MSGKRQGNPGGRVAVLPGRTAWIFHRCMRKICRKDQNKIKYERLRLKDTSPASDRKKHEKILRCGVQVNCCMQNLNEAAYERPYLKDNIPGFREKKA